MEEQDVPGKVGRLQLAQINRRMSFLQIQFEENFMANSQNNQRSGDRDDDDTKSGGKQNGGKGQGSKSGTGTTRAGEEKTSKSQQR